MSTFALSLKHEISRVARKVLRAEVAALRKASTSHRAEIADLKRKFKALELRLRDGERKTDRASKSPDKVASTGRHSPPGAFDAAAFAEQRRQMGLTQVQMAKLLDVSALSVYKWESAGVTPRRAQLEKIAAVGKLSKRAVVTKLGE